MSLTVLGVFFMSLLTDAKQIPGTRSFSYAHPQRINNLDVHHDLLKRQPEANRNNFAPDLGEADRGLGGVRLVPGTFQTTVNVGFVSDEFDLLGVNGVYDADGTFSMDAELRMKNPLAGQNRLPKNHDKRMTFTSKNSPS